jgi:hypothetical protein
VREVHGQRTTDGLHSTLLSMRALDASMPTSLYEISFAIALGNEMGLDKIRKEALIKAVASDIAGAPRRNQRDAPPLVLEIDTDIPNADVKVTEVEDWSNPDNPSVPEVRPARPAAPCRTLGPEPACVA